MSVGSVEDLLSTLSVDEVGYGKYGWDRRLSVIAGDVEDFEVVRRCTDGVSNVIHLAANTGVQPSIENPLSDFMSNSLGTFNLLRASVENNAKKFIFASSGAPLGDVIPPIHENLPTKPLSPYGASKLSGEAYCSAFYHSYGLETVSLRFGNVYGLGSKNKGSVVAKFIKESLDPNITTWRIYGDGKQTRDFIYVEDLVNAIINSVDATNIGGEIFQIATAKETSVLEIADRLNQILESAGFAKMLIENKQHLIGDAKRNYSDTSKARSRLGWVAETELAEGLENTFNYFLNKGRFDEG